MKTSPQRSDSTADEQASLWAARLEGGVLDAPDRAALDAWLAENPLHRTLLSGYCQFSADLEEQLPALVATGAVAMPARKAPARSRWNFSFILGTALATAAVAAFAVWIVRPGSHVENISTTVAHRQSVTLGDGTRVELNARTVLAVTMDRAERHVRLSTGEAFFTVTEDKARPFFVETPQGIVRVTGTAFGVRAGTGTELEVTVMRGSVQVRAGTGDAAPVSLVAGDKLSLGSTGVSVQKLSASELDDALAWRQGQIVFNDEPLAEAVRRFADYHGRTITVSPRAASLGVGGRFSLDDLNGFFAGIADSLKVRLTRDDASGTMRLSLQTEPE